jgi:hypothetical protein
MPKLPKPYTQTKRVTRQELQKILVGSSGSLAPLIKKESLARRVFKATSSHIRKHFDLWSLAWAEFGRGHPLMKRAPGWTAVFLFTGLGQSVLGLIALFYAVAPWYVWPLTLFFSATLGEAFVIHYLSLAKDRLRIEEVNALDETVWQLLDRLHPNLQIDYEPVTGHPFIDTYNNGTVVQHRVTITSPNALNDVELVANKVRTASGEIHSNLHLRPMHDRRPEGTKRVRLKAEKPEAWDVICIADDAVLLNHIAPVGVVEFGPGIHEFELMATGGDRPPKTKTVRLEVKEDHSATFDLVS